MPTPAIRKPARHPRARRSLRYPGCDRVPRARLHFFIAGTGGKLRSIEPGPRSLFARSANGFAMLEADSERFTVTFVDAELRDLYTHTLRRPVRAGGR
jgi:hypothetical protein